GANHVDSGVDQRDHVLVALAVPRPRRVGMGDLVDDGGGGTTKQYGVEIHLLHGDAAIVDAAARDHFQPFDQRRCLGAAVGLDERDHQVHSAAAQIVRFLQNAVRLSHAGSKTDVELQAAAPTALHQ